MLYLGRLMLNPGGLASNAAFRQLGQPLIETSNLYYDGNSQGGIEGGMLTALSPDFRHAVLGVTGDRLRQPARPAQHGLRARSAPCSTPLIPTSRCTRCCWT